MTDYTPTTGQVRDAYVRAMRDAFIASAGEHKAEFDRWLAEHDREVANALIAEGWRKKPTRAEMVEAMKPHVWNDCIVGGVDAAVDDAADAILALMDGGTMTDCTPLIAKARERFAYASGYVEMRKFAIELADALEAATAHQAEHDRQVAAAAWDECWQVAEGWRNGYAPANPYRKEQA